MRSRPLFAIAAGLLFAAGIAACDPVSPPRTTDPNLTPAEVLAAARKLSPLPDPPPSPTNAFADNPAAALFGQRLFYNPDLSANNEIACATCHDPAHGFSDGKALSEGLQTTERHSQALWNLAYQNWFFWDGRADSLWAQALQPLQHEAEMGAPPDHLWAAIGNDPVLRESYDSLFGPFSEIDKNGGPTLDRFLSNLGKALEAYQRRLLSTDSPFDRFIAQTTRTGKLEPTPEFDAAALRGLELFVGRGQCILCHSGPNFSDGEFHNIGLPGEPGDRGRFAGIRKAQADPFNGLGEFSDDRSPAANIKLRYLVVKLNNLGELKTPTLRNVATTAPYMHDGRFATLREVLDFYSDLPGEPAHGHREETLLFLDLSAQEKDDLEAFLKTLTGAPLDAALTRRPPPPPAP